VTAFLKRIKEAAHRHGNVVRRMKARARAQRWKSAHHRVFQKKQAINSKKAQGLSSRNAPYVYIGVLELFGEGYPLEEADFCSLKSYLATYKFPA